MRFRCGRIIIVIIISRYYRKHLSLSYFTLIISLCQLSGTWRLVGFLVVFQYQWAFSNEVPGFTASKTRPHLSSALPHVCTVTKLIEIIWLLFLYLPLTGLLPSFLFFHGLWSILADPWGVALCPGNSTLLSRFCSTNIALCTNSKKFWIWRTVTCSYILWSKPFSTFLAFFSSLRIRYEAKCDNSANLAAY